MAIMESRLINLGYVIDGFSKTQVPLMSFDGNSLTSFSGFDDIGIYIFIPKLVRLLGISLEQALNLFFNTILIGSFIVACFGFFLLYRAWMQRFIVLVEMFLLLLFSLKFLVDDLYIIYVAISLTNIPLFLVLKKQEYNFYSGPFLFIAGLLMGMAHYMRSFSSIGVLTFIVVMLMFEKKLRAIKKIGFISVMAFGMICSSLYITAILHTYKVYGKEHIEGFIEDPTHPFWHSVYLGFGFLSFNNKDRIEWNDTCGEKKAQSRIPGITLNQTHEYEQILKEETKKLIVEQPFFVFLTLFAKIGVLFFYLLIFANIGLIALFFRTKDFLVDGAFVCALAVSSLASLVTVPCLRYASCFIVIATLYSIVSTNIFLSEISWVKSRFFLQGLRQKFFGI